MCTYVCVCIMYMYVVGICVFVRRLATTVIVMFAVAIFISYGLHCYVPVEVVWRGYLEPRLRNAAASPRATVLAEYALRVVLCLLTC